VSDFPIWEVAVGAYKDGQWNSPIRGAAYFFDTSGTEATATRLQPSVINSAQGFGSCVAVSGSSMLVGSSTGLARIIPNITSDVSFELKLNGGLAETRDVAFLPFELVLVTTSDYVSVLRKPNTLNPEQAAAVLDTHHNLANVNCTAVMADTQLQQMFAHWDVDSRGAANLVTTAITSNKNGISVQYQIEFLRKMKYIQCSGDDGASAECVTGHSNTALSKGIVTKTEVCIQDAMLTGPETCCVAKALTGSNGTDASFDNTLYNKVLKLW